MARKCIIAMVKPNLTDQVVNSAKAAGATGATIIPASGTGAGEAKTFSDSVSTYARSWFFFF